MKTDKSTARPWRLNMGSNQEIVSDEAPKRTWGDKNQYSGAHIVCQVGQYNSCTVDEVKANALLIIKSVNEYEALKAVADAAKKMMAFYEDLSKSNPGFLSKLVLQDYGQWNEALCELPSALTALDVANQEWSAQ